jgi:hypothetical protein
MFRTVFNLQTSSEIQVELTEAEIAELQNLPQPTAIPRQIDARRLRLALVELKLFDTVESAIATLPRSAQIDWEYATFIKEDYPLVQALSSSLNLDVTAIFDLAQTLT